MADTLTTPEDALAKRTQLPPALVEEIQENPEAIRPLARGMAAINLFNLFAKVSHPNAPTKDKLEFQRVVNKIGRLEPETVAPSGSGVTITISIPALDAQPERNVVIDQIAEPTFELSAVE
jgi:hypothetical protein